MVSDGDAGPGLRGGGCLNKAGTDPTGASITPAVRGINRPGDLSVHCGNMGEQESVWAQHGVLLSL